MTDLNASLNFCRRAGRFANDLTILSRPLAAICAGAELIVGAHLTCHRDRAGAGEVLMLREGIAIVLITASINVVNDIRDIRADAISRPTRPLPAGRLSTAVAGWLAAVQAASAVLLSIDVPYGMAVAILLLSIGFAYSFVLKGTVLLGNLVVAAMAASPLVYGGYLGRVQPLPTIIASAIVFAFMFAFEVLKTIRDVRADYAAGYRTVATEWGTGAAAAIFRLSLTAYVVAAATPVVLGSVSAYYVVFMGLGAVVPSCVVGWHFPVGRSAIAVTPVLRVMTISWIPGIFALILAAKS